MASPRGVSVLGRAGSPLRAPFLTGIRHFACHFSLIFGYGPYSLDSQLQLCLDAVGGPEREAMTLFGLFLAGTLAGTGVALADTEVVPKEAVGSWTLMKSADTFIGDKGIAVALRSTQKVECKRRESDNVTLFVRCDEDQKEADFFVSTPCDMTYVAGSKYAYIEYRIDEGPVQKDVMLVNPFDNALIHHPPGPKSAEAIRQFLGKESLQLRLAPFGQARVVATFDISGLNEAIKPLPKACNW